MVMIVLQQHVEHYFYFFHVQSEFGGGREEKLILLPQVFWRYLKILATVEQVNVRYYAYFQELVTAVIAFALLLASLVKVRWSYVVFGICAFLLPTLTGTFSSMPRYILVIFPIWMVLSLVMASVSRKIFTIYILLSTVWLLFNTILFIQGYWVA